MTGNGNRRGRVGRRGCAAALLCMLAAPVLLGATADAQAQTQGQAQAQGQERYLFLGDSLSDNQNSYQFTARIFGTDNAVPSVPPYFEGRFSNGYNWTDRIAPDQQFYYQYYLSSPDCLTDNATVAASGACDTALAPDPASVSSLNFAFGGSESGTEELLAAPGFLTVLGDLEGAVADGSISGVDGSVFTVWTGANDYSAYAVSSGGLTEAQAVSQVLDNIAEGTVRIGALGPRRIAILNIQPLETVPTFVEALGPSGAALTGRLADLHNAGLRSRLDGLQSQTGTEIVLVDVHAMYDHINANPALYNFTNITDGCIDETTGARTAGCQTAAQEAGFLYWDGTHPTTVAHGFIAELFDATVQTVDDAPGRLAAIPDSGLIPGRIVTRGVGGQLDQWRAETGRVAMAPGRTVAAEGEETAIFVAAANSWGRRGSDGDFAGYDYDTQGGIVGIEYRPAGLGMPVVLGIHTGVVRLGAETPGGSRGEVSFDNRAVALGAFAGVRHGPASLTAQVTGLRLDIDDVERRTNFSVLPVARSDSQGYGATGEIEGRWDFQLEAGGKPLWIAPLVRLTAAAATVDGFGERDAEYLNLAVQDSSTAEIRTGVGIEVWRDVEIENGLVTPYAGLVWDHDLMDEGREIRGVLSSGQRISAETGGATGHRIIFDAGLRMTLGEALTVDAALSAAIAEGGGGSYVVPQLRVKKIF